MQFLALAAKRVHDEMYLPKILLFAAVSHMTRSYDCCHGNPASSICDPATSGFLYFFYHEYINIISYLYIFRRKLTQCWLIVWESLNEFWLILKNVWNAEQIIWSNIVSVFIEPLYKTPKPKNVADAINSWQNVCLSANF